MLVDNSLPPHFSGADFSDFINTDLFAPAANPSTSSNSSDNESSPPQSPYHALLTTPPQDPPSAAFPDFADPSLSNFASSSSAGPVFSFLDDDPLKSIDPAYDYMSLSGMHQLSMNMNYPGSVPMSLPLSIEGVPMDLSMGLHMGAGLSMNMDDMPHSHGVSATSSDLDSILSIDPSLVGTPALSISTTDFDAGEEDNESCDGQPESSSALTSTSNQNSNSKPKQSDENRERLTLTITPVKVGGHGKSRKGTVQSGGIVKKSALISSSSTSTSKDKENSSSLLLATSSAAQSAATIAMNAAALKKAKSRAMSEALVDGGEPGDVSSPDMIDIKDDLPADWRPPPEVLAKMTSKEKRQLRNKISARNFRVRRKEYISTLEGDIAERDLLLDSIRTELGSTQSENLALRQEIAALKKILLEGRGAEALASLNLPPPAPLAPAMAVVAATPGSQIGAGTGDGSAMLGVLGDSGAAGSASSNGSANDSTLGPHSSTTNASASSSSSPLGLLTPNTQKDLPTSPRLGAVAFWGGATRGGFGANGFGMSGGITPVHTVLVPDLSLSLNGGVDQAEKEQEKTASVTRVLQENMNPALNGNLGAKNVNVSSSFGFGGSGSGAFEGFADINPFTMKTLDAYRMHLWGKMAAQQRYQRDHSQNHHSRSQPQLTGLASSLRPHFFSASSSASLYPTPPSTPPSSNSHSSHPHYPMGNNLSALLSGKHSVSGLGYSALPTPPGSPNLKGITSDREKEMERLREREKEREHAALAALAGQTLLRKLGGAFWDAFSGHSTPGTSVSASSTTPSSSGTKSWDVDKVRKVLEGKAVVRVLDVDAPAAAAATTGRSEEKKCKNCSCSVSEILEEGMRSLTLGKKV
ncbi:hypothetical protein AX17_004740 [Amanita inopinata Kibby_2008]|nr:hypothetical protein AX17_004740 [Amanita inopinata Kibby_2008]